MTRLGVVALCCGLLLPACSDGPTIGEYADEVEAITRIMQRESVAALPDPGQMTRDGVAGVNDARRAALEALRALDAPDSLLPEHTAVVAAFDALVETADGFLSETSDLDIGAFTDAVLSARSLDALAGRVAASCDLLEERLRQLGHAVPVAC